MLQFSLALTAALAALQGANEARATFLTEEALASELVLAEQLDGEVYETIEEALAALEDGDFDLDDISGAVARALATAAGEGEGGAETALETVRADVAAAVGVLDGLDVAVDYSPENDQVAVSAIESFDGASRNIQDTIISESQAVLTEVTEATEAAVSEVTGLSGRIATLQTRKSEFEAALEEQSVAETAYNNQALAFAATTAAEYDAAVDNVPEVAGDAVAVLDDGTWIATDAGNGLNGINELLAALQTQTDSQTASTTAKTRFETALARVVEAETAGTENQVTVDQYDAGTGYADADVEEDVTITLSLDELNAPLSQALIDLRESQAELDVALTNLTEARELADTLEARNDDIDAAEAVFEDNFDLNLEVVDEATAGNDLFLFEADRGNGGVNGEDEGYVVTLFGEQGQDHIFFGNTDYQLVELTGDQTINDRVGSADQLEVFWKQNGANLDLFVEFEAAAGTDLNALNVTKVTLTEFSAENILDGQLNEGLLSTNTAPVEVA